MEKAVENWVVGINTAPRKDCTLRRCLNSVIVNGWKPHVYAEPGSTDTSDIEEVTRVDRPHRFGAWYNWLEMCKELVDKYPDADAFLTMQDDTIVAPRSREFCEWDLWPDPSTGFVSLYTPKHYQVNYVVIEDATNKRIKRFSNSAHASKFVKRRKSPHHVQKELRPIGCHRIFTKSLWGACALIFPSTVLKELLVHPSTASWRGVRFRKRKRIRQDWEIANVDSAIGVILNRMGRQMWFYQPSLAQHVAHYSTLNHGGLGGRRSAHFFIGDDNIIDVYSKQWKRERYTINGLPRKDYDFSKIHLSDIPEEMSIRKLKYEIKGNVLCSGMPEDFQDNYKYDINQPTDFIVINDQDKLRDTSILSCVGAKTHILIWKYNHSEILSEVVGDVCCLFDKYISYMGHDFTTLSPCIKDSGDDV